MLIPTWTVPILTAGKEFSTLLVHLTVSGKVWNQVCTIFPSYYLMAPECFNGLIYIHPTIGLGRSDIWSSPMVKSKYLYIYIHFMVESWPQRFIGILRIEPQKTQHYECEVVTPRPSWPKKPFEQQTPKRRFPVCQSALKHTLNVWSVRLRWVAIFDVWEDGDDWLEVGGL